MNEQIKYDELLKEIKEQKQMLQQIIASITTIQKSQQNTMKKYKKMPIFCPGLTFQSLINNIDQYINITAIEIMKFKDMGYVKALVFFLSGCFNKFQDFEIPLKIIDRRRKIFYTKTENCWCTEKEYNDKQFDILLDNFSHFIYKSCFCIHTQNPQEFCVLTMNEIQTIILQAKLDSDMNKRIRYKFLNTF